jgi:hypothetical protein
MKTATLLKVLVLSITLFACGPSQSEIKQQAQREQEIKDSLTEAFNEKLKEEEEKRLQLENEKAVADSIAKSKANELEQKLNNPSELKQDLASLERQNPPDYLSVSFQTDYKPIGGKTIVKGAIKNNATVTTYKDIRMEIFCYTKTRTLIKKLPITLYEYIRPGEVSRFEHKFKSPKGTKLIDMRIVAVKFS